MYNVVVPGDFISTEVNRAGEGTYVEDGNVYAMKYGVLDDRGTIKVVALSGKYMPVNGDVVIGKIVEISFPYWIVDIASPYEARLRKSEFGRGENIDFGNMCEYLDINDLIVAKVMNVDVMMRIDLALKNEFKMDDVGRLIEVSPAKVPRIIGRSGSMIRLLKDKCNCFIFVAKNGRIWIKGSSADMDLASQTVMKIANEAHTSGLTDRMAHFLDSVKSGKGEG
jgi:exosome complex component RRP4